MYLHGNHYYPAVGVPAVEFRPLVEELTRLRQSQGLDAQMTETLYGEDYPAVHLTIRFAELGALDKFRSEQLTAGSALATRISRHVRTGTSTTLSERLVAPLPGGNIKYQVRLTYRPALGKGGELRELLTEHAKARQAQGVRMTINTQVAGPDSGSYVLLSAFESLAAYEAYRADTRVNPTVLGFGGKVNALIGAPTKTDIREVRVPFPTR